MSTDSENLDELDIDLILSGYRFKQEFKGA